MDGKVIRAEARIEAKASTVWEVLTNPVIMKQWMSDDDDFQLELETEWKVGGKFITKGFHHVHFENTGEILDLIPGEKLVYTHLSSISELDNTPENHCVFEFNLQEQADFTLLQLRITNFPTETIYKHLELYWKATMNVIRQFIEEK